MVVVGNGPGPTFQDVNNQQDSVYVPGVQKVEHSVNPALTLVQAYLVLSYSILSVIPRHRLGLFRQSAPVVSVS